MEFRRLGNSGLRVSKLCLGTMAFGRWIDERQSAEVIDAAFDVGINFIDTADVYGPGQDSGKHEEKGVSETILGKLLGKRRQHIVLATKVWQPMGDGPNDGGLSRKHILDAIDASLRRLQTDYIDLYQCHRFDPDVPLEETLRAFDDLIRQGKVRYIGCSNWAAWQIAKAHGLSDLKGLPRFISVQPQYSLLVRDIERELMPFCESEGVGIIPYSPIARGFLTGKYRKGEAPPENTRAAHGEPRLKLLMTEKNWERVEAFRAVCAEWGMSMAHVALAWVLSKPAITSAIVGASRPFHVTDAAEAASLTLSNEQIERLDEMFALDA